jgi:hypothetical protein
MQPRCETKGSLRDAQPRMEHRLGGFDPPNHRTVVVVAGEIDVGKLDQAAKRDARWSRSWCELQVNKRILCAALLR